MEREVVSSYDLVTSLLKRWEVRDFARSVAYPGLRCSIA